MSRCDRCELEPAAMGSVDISPPGQVCDNCERTLAASHDARAHVYGWRARWAQALEQ